jgi:hypothetical protein
MMKLAKKGVAEPRIVGVTGWPGAAFPAGGRSDRVIRQPPRTY